MFKELTDEITDANINQYINRVKNHIKQYDLLLTKDQLKQLKEIIEKIDNYFKLKKNNQKMSDEWQQIKKGIKETVLKNYPRIINFKQIKNLDDLITNNNPVIIYLLKTDDDFVTQFQNKLNTQNQKKRNKLNLNDYLIMFLEKLKSIKEVKDELDINLLKIINNKGKIIIMIGNNHISFSCFIGRNNIDKNNIKMWEIFCSHTARCKNLIAKDYDKIIKYVESKKHFTILPEKLNQKQIKMWQRSGTIYIDKPETFKKKKLKGVAPKEILLTPYPDIVQKYKTIVLKYMHLYLKEFYNFFEDKSFFLQLKTHKKEVKLDSQDLTINHIKVEVINETTQREQKKKIMEIMQGKQQVFLQEIRIELQKITDFLQLNKLYNKLKQNSQYKNKTSQQCCDSLVRDKIKKIWASMNSTSWRAQTTNKNLDLIISDQQPDTVPEDFKNSKEENNINNLQNYTNLFKLFNLRLIATKELKNKKQSMQLIIKLLKFLDKKTFDDDIYQDYLSRRKVFERKFIIYLVLMKNHKSLKEYLNGSEEIPVKLNLTSQEIFKVIRKVIKLDKIFSNFFESLHVSLDVIQKIEDLNEQKYIKAVLQGWGEFEKYKQDYINRYVARILKSTLDINNKKNLKIKFNNLLYIINNTEKSLNWCKNFKPYYNKKITTSDDLESIAKLINAYLKSGRFSTLNDWEQLFKWLEQKTFKLKKQQIITGAKKSIVDLYSFGFVWFLSQNKENLALKLLDENKNILQLPGVLSATLETIIRKSKKHIFSEKVWKKIIKLCNNKKLRKLILLIKQQNEEQLYSMLTYSNLIKKGSQAIIINVITILRITVKDYVLPGEIVMIMKHFLPVVIFICNRNKNDKIADNITEIISFLKLNGFIINGTTVQLTERDFSLYYWMCFYNAKKNKNLQKFKKFQPLIKKTDKDCFLRLKDFEHNFKMEKLFKYYSNANFSDIWEKVIKCRVRLDLVKHYVDEKNFSKAMLAYHAYCRHCEWEMRKITNQKPFHQIDEEQLKLFADLNSLCNQSNEILKQNISSETFFKLIEMSIKFKKLYFIPFDKNKDNFAKRFSKYQKEKFQSPRNLNLKQKLYKITAGIVNDILNKKMPIKYNELVSMIAKTVIKCINLLCKNIDNYQFAACIWKYKDYEKIRNIIKRNKSLLQSFDSAIVKLVELCFRKSSKLNYDQKDKLITNKFWMDAIEKHKKFIKDDGYPYAFMFVTYIAWNAKKIGEKFELENFKRIYDDLDKVCIILTGLCSYSLGTYKYKNSVFCKNLPTFKVCNKILEQIDKAIKNLKKEQKDEEDILWGKPLKLKPKTSYFWKDFAKNIVHALSPKKKPTNPKIMAIKKLISEFQELKREFIEENTGIMYKLTERCKNIQKLKNNLLKEQMKKLKNTNKKIKNHSPRKTQNYSYLDSAIKFYNKAKGKYAKEEETVTQRHQCISFL
ncbi:MAG: hypothetical protein PVG30_04755 [Gammaproteobacteria bacterium]